MSITIKFDNIPQFVGQIETQKATTKPDYWDYPTIDLHGALQVVSTGLEAGHGVKVEPRGEVKGEGQYSVEWYDMDEMPIGPCYYAVQNDALNDLRQVVEADKVVVSIRRQHGETMLRVEKNAHVDFDGELFASGGWGRIVGAINQGFSNWRPMHVEYDERRGVFLASDKLIERKEATDDPC